MSMGPIPWTAIDRWAESEGLADRDRFRHLIRAMDTVFMAAVGDQEGSGGD